MVKKIISSLKKKDNLVLLLILVIGLFFRLYKLDSFYTFEHDQDLYSWIVRDIVVNHHFRLIGQLTSIDGLFIGPLFYYMLIPFFILFNMNPLGALVPVVILGIFTVFSFYFVFSSLFSKRVGLIAAFIYSVSLGSVFYDRWVVPTQPTILWSVWFLYVAFNLLKGNFKVIPVFALLVGLIWHIHIALAPLMILVPLATFFLRNERLKKISWKNMILSFSVFMALTLPFWLFEFKHGFQQINGLLSSFAQGDAAVSGWPRFVSILESIVRLFRGMLWVDNRIIPLGVTILVWFTMGAAGYYLVLRRVISSKQMILVVLWTVVVVASQQFSKELLSEYYFLSLFVLFVLLASLFLSYLYRSFGRQVLNIVFATFLILNFLQLINMPEPSDSFKQKKETIEYIKNDMVLQNYACAGINYIANFGAGVGFRYLMVFKGMHTINPTEGVPVYNIVIPWERAKNEIDAKFGRFGVIKPKNQEFEDKAKCNDPRNQLLPLLMFTN